MKYQTTISWFTRTGIVIICALFCYILPAQGSDKTKNKKIIKFGIISDVHDDTARIRTFIEQAKIENRTLLSN